MNKGYQIDQYFKVKVEKKYPWPCPSDPNRMLDLYFDDVLTGSNGKYTCHTGLMKCNIILQDDEVEFVTKPVTLVMM